MAAPNNALKVFFSSLSPKEKKILYITAAVVCLALFDRLLLSPLTHEGRLYEEKIDNATRTIRQSLLILRYKDAIASDEKSHSIFYTAKGLTSEEMISTFLAEVEEMAKSSGLSLSNINPVNPEDKKGYVQYNLTIECTGTMKQLTDFIYAIESSRKPIRVAAYDISPKNRDNYEVKVTMTIAKMILIPGNEELAARAAKEKEKEKAAAKAPKPAPVKTE